MIKRISRNQLNIEKYTACLNRAVNYRIYAEFWYLDVLTDQQWDCFVYKDYEAVMPIPFQKKLGIKFISQPVYCQQLGVFHDEDLPEEILKRFHKKLKSNLVRGYHFNEENQAILKLSNQKINQLLPLDFDYENFINSIRKNRKQEIVKGLPETYKIEISNEDQSFIELLKFDYQDISKQLNLNKLTKLVEEIQQRNLGLTVNILQQNEVVASSFYIQSKNRLIQLCNAKKEHSKINYNTFIVDRIIKSYLKQGLILDFEGSSLKGVNEFNASFRAKDSYFGTFKSKTFQVFFKQN